MSIPESGVGIIYFSGFEQILESNPDLIQVIEIEPQTFWYRSNSGLDSFTFDKEKVDYLKSSQKTKLFHGVGYPIGGILQPNINHLGCLKQMELELNPVGMSEHLSFNNIKIDNHILNTNFLLPPLQSPEGLEIAVNSILKYKNYFNIPFSFETGVNYLAPKNYEIEDGLFINTVAENSNCDILLDIHNIIANERNGRQKVRNFFKQISHERVTQIHLAGGFYYKGYYLDAHSNISSDEIIKVFENIVCQLPNLKAIIFEMLPEYLSFIPQNAISIQLEKMNRIWERRGIYHKRNKIVSNKKINSPPPTVAEWELTLGTLAIGRDLTCDTEL
ncbi:MAG: DUF692 family protein [Saprospiraceae bacterium]|nr:DUF692 family protein [Candidatus Vicinibacter affinis]